MPHQDYLLHVISEIIAIIIIAPYLLYLASKTDNKLDQIALIIIAILTIIVDGYLLVRWYNNSR